MSPPNYPFLSFPPPLPNAAITRWAARVQPGSPPSPSPRRTSYSRRPSLSYSRRPSLSHSRKSSASFINHLDTPSTATKTASPSLDDFTPDLLSLGYTAVFVPLPKRTETAPKTPLSPVHNIPIPQQDDTRPLKHSRSLSVLKPIRFRARSKSVTANTPTPLSAQSLSNKMTKPLAPKHKKPKNTPIRPLPLANQLELLQFLDGGSIDSNIKRIMEAQARATAPTHLKKAGNYPIGDVFRDGQGGIWWDQEEQWEFALLLGNDDDIDGDYHHDDDDDDWVMFKDKENSRPDQERRASLSIEEASRPDSKLLVKPASDDDLAAFGGALPPQILRQPVSSVLTGRSRMAARQFSPRSTTSRFPVSPFAAPIKGKPRRRPAPLKLAPIAHPWKWPTNSPIIDAEQVRRDFLDGSFDPPPINVRTAPHTSVPWVAGRSRKRSFATSRNAMDGTTETRNTKKMWWLFRK